MLIYSPGSLSKSARDVISVGSNLLQLEAHDQVHGKINSSLSMVAKGDWARKGENLRDGAADELEWVVLVAS
jgi:hypothetical protein